MKRKASIATAAVFLAVLFGFSLLHLALPDRILLSTVSLKTLTCLGPGVWER